MELNRRGWPFKPPTKSPKWFEVNDLDDDDDLGSDNKWDKRHHRRPPSPFACGGARLIPQQASM